MDRTVHISPQSIKIEYKGIIGHYNVQDTRINGRYVKETFIKSLETDQNFSQKKNLKTYNSQEIHKTSAQEIIYTLKVYKRESDTIQKSKRKINFSTEKIINPLQIKQKNKKILYTKPTIYIC